MPASVTRDIPVRPPLVLTAVGILGGAAILLPFLALLVGVDLARLTAAAHAASASSPASPFHLDLSQATKQPDEDPA